MNLAKQVVISMGGENWLWETVPWQLCLLVKGKKIIIRAIGCVLAFRQKEGQAMKSFLSISWQI